ncbi:MAG: hypothetical protein PHR21_00380 [Oscillospiraceae bacterium]|nr:hypothetical protein [Oscillospiraceae bacterium]MDD4368963.1 hypothetical protein [Oscillospiraceae bacterium]
METPLKDIQAAEQRARETVAEARRAAAELLEQADAETARLTAVYRQKWEQYQQVKAAEQARLLQQQAAEQARRLVELQDQLRQRLAALQPALCTRLIAKLLDEA